MTNSNVPNTSAGSVPDPALSTVALTAAIGQQPATAAWGLNPTAGDGEAWPAVPGYEIVGELGRGGMGVVYKARQANLGRMVALKVILAGAHAGAEERARFRAEAEAVARLLHPNVVQIYEVGERDGLPYFSLEFCPGGSLDGRLNGTPLPPHEAGRLIETLARAVHVAHRHGIVHRDLKPANVLLAEDGMPKIADFGLAKKLDEAGQTVTGAVLGTPSYMAPEQARGRGKAAGPAADVYALGAILYECLTGRPPFRAATWVETLQQVAADEPVPPRRLNPAVPHDLETIALKCLEKAPQQRYASALELGEDLRRFQAGEPVKARPLGVAGRTWRWACRHPACAALAGSVLALVVGAIGGTLVVLHQVDQRRADRARRDGEQRQAVEFALEKAADLRQRADTREAGAVLEQAQQVLGGAGPDDLRRRLEAAQAELALINRLDGVCQRRANWTKDGFDYATAAREYAAAFQEAGLGAVGDDEDSVAGRVRASPVAGSLVAALDDWAGLAHESSRSWLLQVARRADPHPWGDRFRDPEVRHAGPALQALADEIMQDGGARLGELSPQLLAALGLLLHQKAGDAAPLLRAAQRRYPNDFWLSLNLANVLFDFEKWEEAYGYTLVAVALRPDAASAHNNLGRILYARKDLDGALAEYQKAIELDPKFAAAHNNLGAALYDKKDLDGAIAACRQALALDPNLAHAHNNIGLALGAKKDVDGALAEFRQALECDPKLAQAHNNLGLALRARKDVEGAIVEYRKAIELNPKYAHAHNNLGNALYSKGDQTGAIAAYRRSIEADPKYVSARYNLGNALRQTHDLDGAIAAYHKVIELDPRYFMAHYNLGGILRERKDFPAAIAEYRRTIGIAPDYPEAHCNLGHMLRDQGQFAEALQELRRGHELGTKRSGWEYPSARWVSRAESLVAVDQKLPAILGGQAEPADAAEGLALAQLCQQYKDRHAAATRLYAAAFAADAALADDLGELHRYNAACSAALAAVGRAADAGNLPDRVRLLLRRQALSWLRDELALCAKYMAPGAPESSTVRQRLAQWRTDADLATVRDQAALDNLPDDERQEWLRLWQDVAALRQEVDKTQ